MKQAISTSVEQSRRLLACGVDPKTADMVWLEFEDGFHLVVNTESGEDTTADEIINTPVWSLTALCKLIPQRILAPHADTPCDFILHHHPELWIAMYHDGKSFGDSEDYMWQCCSECRAEDPIEACVQMIEWLVANKYELNID